MKLNKKEYDKKYYENNYDKIEKKLLRKITCVTCNVEMYIGNYSNHRKTQKHMDNVAKTQQLFEAMEDGEDIKVKEE